MFTTEELNLMLEIFNKSTFQFSGEDLDIQAPKLIQLKSAIVEAIAEGPTP